MLDPKTAFAAFVSITERDLRDIDRETRSRISAAQSAIGKLLEVLGPPPAPGVQPTVRAREIEWSADTLAKVGLEFAALAARCRDVGERQTLLTQLAPAAGMEH